MSLRIPLFPPRSEDPSGVVAQTWVLTVSKPLDPSTDLAEFTRQARDRAITAMDQTLNDQGYYDLPRGPYDDLHVEIVPRDPLHWALNFT